MSRTSTLLIRGGANYAYEQINDELVKFVRKHFQLAEGAVEVAVVGMKVDTEHTSHQNLIKINLKLAQIFQEIPPILPKFSRKFFKPQPPLPLVLLWSGSFRIRL